MSAQATAYVWRESPFAGATFIVHLALADVANDAHANQLWMSLGAIAAKARVSRSTASVALKDLRDGGFLILIESGAINRKPSRYWMRTSPDSEQSQITRPQGGTDTRGERSSTSPVSGRITKENSKNSSPTPIASLPKSEPPWRTLGITPEEWIHSEASR